MGRKKKWQEPRKVFAVRLSAHEKKIMESRARVQGMQPSEYIRHLIMNEGHMDVDAVYDRKELIRQIAAIGNNINQIARVDNTTGKVYGSDLMCLKEYISEIRKLIEDMGAGKKS